MRADAAAADRKQAVRETARRWFAAGYVTGATLAAIEAEYPDDRIRAGRTFRILICAFIYLAAQAAVLLPILWLGLNSLHEYFPVLALAGIAGVIATDYLIGPLKRRQGGIEAALSFFAVMQLSILAIAWSSENRQESILFLSIAAVFGAAAWRWGYSAYAGIASICLFLAASRLPLGRLLWVLIPLLLFRPLLSACDTIKLSPSHRRCAAVTLLACIAALYAAVNVVSLDKRLIGSETGEYGPGIRTLSMILTGAVPVLVLIAGVFSRRRLLLNAAIVLAVASLLTLRYYVHIAPLWIVLGASGAIVLALVSVLQRVLNSGEGKEWRGITARPLLHDPEKRSVLEAVSSVAAVTPSARPIAGESSFEGGGGKFGGGGASGTF